MKIKDILREIQTRELSIQGLVCQQVQNSKNGYHDAKTLKKIVRAGNELEDYLNKKVVIE